MSNTHEAQSEMTKQDTLPPLEQERAAFEAWYAEDASKDHPGWMKPSDIFELREGDHYGDHRVMLNGKWEGWQARAAIAAQTQQSLPDGQQFCYCGDEISLQGVSGGAAPEGLYGSVTLNVGGEFIRYAKQAQQAQGVPVGWLYGNSFWAAGNPRITEHIKQHGEALFRAAAPQAEPQPKRSCEYCDGTGDVHSLDGEWRGECSECPAAALHAFKNFHRLLCERFGYGRDEKDWQRDQVSLIEFIAGKAEHQPEREPTTWSRYVAGMIACYLQWPDDDERTEAVAGIIERRRWSDRQPELEPMNPDQSASFQWLERLCEPALYLDRLGPLRDYLRTHGIGTKGGE